ncbi:MAG TPA: hypothetical protein VM582_05480 [Candidatus Thermoplasmatota archaeon]|nr:hypothetical protein [Candidatus Thermoplasmatota archaeon]
MHDAEDAPLLLRPMTREDVAAVAALAREQGRNVAEEEYERFLSLEGARGYVLTRNEALLGAATVLRYFEHAFLGPVVLREGGDGLTIALLARLVEAMQREGVSVLEAEAGMAEEPVLARMGFATLRRTLVLERRQGARRGASDARAGSVGMRDDHFLDIGALDAAAVGHGRKQYLMALMRELPAGARVVEREGEVHGYALLRRTPRGYALGPVVTRAGEAATAVALVQDALAAARDASVVILVPLESPLEAALEKEGFEPVGSLARMRAGARPEGGDDATEWAVGSRMTG